MKVLRADFDNTGERIAFFALLFCFFSVSLAYLLNSLWLDELITGWIIKDGLHETVRRSLDFQGQSPLYYLLLSGVTKIFGNTEAALRMPSLLAVAASTYLFFRIAAELVDRELALQSCLVFLCFDGIFEAAVFARPYGIALFFSLLSTHLLMQSIATGRLLVKAWYLLALLLMFYTHYVFVLIAPVHFVLLITRGAQSRYSVSEFLVTLLLFGALCTPAVPQLMQLSSRSKLLSFSRPELFNLLRRILPMSIFVGLGIGLLISKLHKGHSKSTGKKIGGTVQILIFWYLLAPIFFFVSSRLGLFSIFSYRYFIWGAPAGALLAVLLVNQITSTKGARIALTALSVTTLALRIHNQAPSEDWSNAAKALASEKSGLLLFYPSLVESQDISWIKTSSTREYLMSPLSYYGPKAETELLPLHLGVPASEAYWRSEIEPSLAEQTKVSVLMLDTFTWKSPDGPVKPSNYLTQLMDSEGFAVQETKSFGKVRVLEFKRKPLLQAFLSESK